MAEFKDCSPEESATLDDLQQVINKAIKSYLDGTGRKMIPAQMVAGLLAGMAGKCYQQDNDDDAEEASCFLLVNGLIGYGRGDIAKRVADDYEVYTKQRDELTRQCSDMVDLDETSGEHLSKLANFNPRKFDA